MYFLNKNFPIWRFRNCLRLSQLQLSELTGISQPTVSRLEQLQILPLKYFNMCNILLHYEKQLIFKKTETCTQGYKCDNCVYGGRANSEMAQDIIFNVNKPCGNNFKCPLLKSCVDLGCQKCTHNLILKGD